MKKIALWFLIFLFTIPPVAQASLYRDTNRFTYGFQRLFSAPFQIPIRTLEGTLSGPLLVGTIGGLLNGTARTLSDAVGGTFDMAASAAPYAKYAVFFA